MDGEGAWMEDEIPESPTESVGLHCGYSRPPHVTMLTDYLQGAEVSKLPAPSSKGRKRSTGSKKRSPPVTALNGGTCSASEQQVMVRRVVEKAGARNLAESCALSEFESCAVNESEPPSQADKIKGGEKGSEGNVVDFNDELVATRLRQLSIGTTGVHAMEAAEVEANKQEQEDEMMVLQAIFGEDLKVVKVEEGCPSVFTISVHGETPTKVMVSAELPPLSLPPAESCTSGQSVDTPENSSSKDGSTSASKSNRSEYEGNVHEFAVEFLPPIIFMCTFPPTYPSRSPPNFVLMSWWLQQSSLASLCRVLDSIWKDQRGQVVCYAWVSWLQENYLNHLGFCDKVILGLPENGAQKPFNVRAISGCHSVDVVVPRLMSYNEERLYQRFCDSLHSCNICLSEFPGKEFIRLPCGHTFCRACMSQYCGGLVKEGSVNKIICPDISCKQQIPPFLLKELLTALDFQRWEDLTLQRALDSMTDIEYCPRCQMACIEDEDHHVQCGKCFYSFCSICRAQWHVIDKCASSNEMLTIIQERQRRSQMGAAQRKKEQDRLNDLLSLKVVNANSTRCPTCNIAIQKDGGCNKMYCTYCCSYFCFVCLAKIDDYNHFGQDKCALFERADIERWEADLLYV